MSNTQKRSIVYTALAACVLVTATVLLGACNTTHNHYHMDELQTKDAKTAAGSR